MPRLMDPPVARDDVAVKLDRELVRQARHVAVDRGLTIAEYLSERLRPLIAQDFDEMMKGLRAPRKTRRRKEEE